MARVGREVKVVCTMLDWEQEARARAGSKIKGEQRTTIFQLEFDLFVAMKKRRKYEKFNDRRCPTRSSQYGD